jgi:hypothetical protein
MAIPTNILTTTPVPFPTVTILANGQSITGSFYKIAVLASGSQVGTTGSPSAYNPAHFLALKDANNNNMIPSALSGSGIFIPPGTIMDMYITSASLDSTSAPVAFYSY